MNVIEKAPDCCNNAGAQVELNFEKIFSTNPDSVKPLKKVFSKGGFDFEQIARVDLWAVYRKRDPQWPKDSWSFEVIKIHVRPFEVTYNRQYQPREVYPRSEDWGERAFTYQTEKEALERLQRETMEPSMLAK
ncbi:MAG: hypothetical protein AB3N14_13590 [Flavobacteriaceae bacterium]